jgi:CheY-like chemotaxis protein
VGPQRILIAEDNDDLRDLFKSWLRAAGFDVLEAGDGLSALRALDGSRPDLVVLDLGLPFITGFEISRQLSQLHTRRIPVVVVTALASDQTAHLDVFLRFTKTRDGGRFDRHREARSDSGCAWSGRGLNQPFSGRYSAQ